MAVVQLEGWNELQKALDRIDDTLTHRTKQDALRAAAGVVKSRAVQLCPEGDESHHPGKFALHETIDYELRDYGQRGLAIIGPVYPQGAHGHLVEDGHEIVTTDGKRTGRRALPQPFIRPAFEGTKSEQQAAMQGVVDRTLREIGG